MRIVISAQSGQPIYEQIKKQIISQIAAGDLPPDSALPSIRYTAKELGVGIITVKRAYDDLCAEGWCYSLQGKGVFVSPQKDMAERKFMAELEEKLKNIADYAAASGVGIDKLIELLNEIKGE